MITERKLAENDRPVLQASLAADAYHHDTPAAFFYDPFSVCNVYEDSKGPIMFVRGSKALRLDIQYVDNNDWRRNVRAMFAHFDALAKKARENGFSEIIFNTNSPELEEFCKARFGFVKSCGELRKIL